jgi:hypothetical protein
MILCQIVQDTFGIIAIKPPLAIIAKNLLHILHVF